MSNPNQSYFDKYFDPVVRDIDRVNIYEFENGMDYELVQSGEEINLDSIKKAQAKVLKNLKKDPAYYTNMLAAESVKMFGEYGTGKGRSVKSSTAKEAEAVKKDGKMPKENKQDSPFGVKDEVKGKYKSSGMEPAKKALKESYNSIDELPTPAMLINMEPSRLKAAIEAMDEKDKNAFKMKFKNTLPKFKDQLKKKLEDINLDLDLNETKGIPAEQLKKLKALVNKFKEEGKKDLADALERLINKGLDETMDYKISNQSTSTDPGYYSHGTTKYFDENVNVGDSRKIRLTPTTKNQILTLVHEMAKQIKEGDAYDVKTSSGQVITKSFPNDNAAREFDRQNNNIVSVQKIR